MAKKFEVVERPQYYLIVYGDLHICRFPRRKDNVNRLHNLKTNDGKRAAVACELMNKAKEKIIGERKKT